MGDRVQLRSPHLRRLGSVLALDSPLQELLTPVGHLCPTRAARVSTRSETVLGPVVSQLLKIHFFSPVGI